MSLRLRISKAIYKGGNYAYNGGTYDTLYYGDPSKLALFIAIIPGIGELLQGNGRPCGSNFFNDMVRIKDGNAVIHEDRNVGDKFIQLFSIGTAVVGIIRL